MRSNKREVESLRERLNQADRWLPIAEEIAQRVQAITDNLNGNDLEITMAEILKAAEEHERKKHILEIFNNLPAEYRCSIFLTLFDDDETKAAVEKERLTLINSNLRMNSVEAISKRALNEGILDTRDIAPGTIVRVELYTREDFEYMDSGNGLRGRSDVRTITSRSMDNGLFHVLGDSQDAWDESIPQLADHQHLEFGSASYESSEEFISEIYYGTRLDGRFLDEVKPFDAIDYNDRVDLVIGAVLLDNILVMGGDDQKR